MQKIYTEVLPSNELRQFVDCYWVLSADGPGGQEDHRVIPDLCNDIIFDVGRSAFPSFGGSSAQVVGAMTRPNCSSIVPGIKLCGIRFKPLGAAAVPGIPVGELKDLQIDLCDLGLNGFNLRDALAEIGDSQKQIQYVDSFLKRRMHIFTAIDQRLCAAIEITAKAAGRVSIDSLSRTLNLSRRHLSRMFSDQTGLSPKEFCRIVRVRNALQQIRLLSCRPDWSNLALEYGYFDQAHFINDFRSVVGISPHQYWANETTLGEGSLAPLPDQMAPAAS